MKRKHSAVYQSEGRGCIPTKSGLFAIPIIWCLLFATSSFAQSYQWAFSVGSATDDEGHDIATDGSSNVYVTGAFEGTEDFDPGAGIANLIAAGGSEDIFVAKYNSAGVYQWAFNLGGTVSDQGNSIAVNGSDVYVTGYFQGTADFDPGPGIANLISVGTSDIFVAKYNAAGVYQWAFNVGSPVGDQGNGIAIDISTNDVYITGRFTSTADFDPGAGIANLSSTSAGIPDGYVAKYNSAGVYQWAFNVGSTSADEGLGIVTDGSDVYVTGNFQGTTDFDPGAGIANRTAVGVYDVFVAKYNSAGIYQWAFGVGSTSTDFGHTITIDGSSNVYISGYFAGTADFDPGAGITNLTPAAVQDIYVAKYNSAGIYQWAFKVGSTSADVGYAIVTDASSNVYVTGGFEGTADFDPGAGIANLTSTGGAADIFVAIYNSAGVYQCAFNVGSTSGEYGGYGIALDGSANIYITGSFQSIADFDPGAGTANFPSAGGYDIFVAKYTGCFSTILTVTPSQTNPLCNGQCTGTAAAAVAGGSPSYTYAWSPSGGTNANATGLCAGTYTVTVTDAVPTTVTATVTITQPTLLTATATATAASCNLLCNGTATVSAGGGNPNYTYLWNNATAQTTANATGLCAGSYTVTVTDANNCPTIQTVTITEPTAITATIASTPAACNNSNGNATVTAGGGTGTFTYLWNPTNQTTSTASGLTAGNYSVMVTDANGCTQTQTVTVTSIGGFTLTASSTQTGCNVNNGTAIANPSNGPTPYTYSWSNNQTAQTATGLATGNYTVIVTDANGCTQTQTVSVTQTPGPTASATATPISIALGASTTLSVTGTGTYQWSPATGLSCTTCANPVATPSQTTIYCVVVTDVNGCSASDCITVNVDIPCGKLFIPNAFSPNHDGQNEMECVMGGCIETLHLAIYDRWGGKVFETTDPKICWDGNYKDKPLDSAVFVYYMDATLTNGEYIKKKGNISLIR